jgi:hypothetical protein
MGRRSGGRSKGLGRLLTKELSSAGAASLRPTGVQAGNQLSLSELIARK